MGTQTYGGPSLGQFYGCVWWAPLSHHILNPCFCLSFVLGFLQPRPSSGMLSNYSKWSLVSKDALSPREPCFMLFTSSCGLLFLNPLWAVTHASPMETAEVTLHNFWTWGIGVLSVSTWCSWTQADTLQGCSSGPPVRRNWGICLKVLAKLPAVSQRQRASCDIQAIPSWIPDIIERWWAVSLYLIDFLTSETWGEISWCFKPLAFGIVT